MKILILGGTLFLGPHLVEHALTNGHQVTVLHRGTHQITFSKPVEHIYADRKKDLGVLKGRFFDAVIDTSAQDPEDVERSTAALQGSAAQYTFISSTSVYSDFSTPDKDESALVYNSEIADVDDPAQKFGLSKALCEKLTVSAFPNNFLIFRPGLIVGRLDSTDRFTYWVRKFSQDGPVALPAPSTRPLQVIDVRDLAAWIINRIETHDTGIYNATGPKDELTFDNLRDIVSKVAQSNPTPVWIPDQFLLKYGLQWWTDLPFWIPDEKSTFKYFMHVNNDKALKNGLTFRPIQQTIQDILEWDQSRSTVKLKAGLEADQEKKLVDDFTKYTDQNP